MAERALKKEFGCVGCASVKKVISCVCRLEKEQATKKRVLSIQLSTSTSLAAEGRALANIAREFPGRHDKGDGGSNRLIVVPFDIPAHLDYAMKGFSLFSSH